MARIASLVTILVLSAFALSAVVVAPIALADGDPASDVLLGQSVFYPYAPPVSASVQQTLNAETAAAKREGLPIKVALIAAPTDLGVIPDLFGKPQSYADFLDQEISFQGKQLLLVVMADGYGTQGLAAPAKLAVAKLRPPAGRTSTDLAEAAIVGVAKLAAASGHPLQGVSGVPGSAGGGGGGGGSSTLIVAGLAVAAVLVASTLVVLRRRGRPATRSG